MAEHLNWARKYRPRNLKEYMGEAIKAKMLSRLSDPANYPRVILLEGDRGSGKTSLARLIGKELLCEHKVNGLSCDECDMCREINENLLFADNGDGVDNILEINVATDGGKDAVNEIIENMDVEPLYGNYKICILDECHRLTTGAQNALLKRLEEPKAYEVYILCTTEADKLLQPIKSRCEVTLHVKAASLEDLVVRLTDICLAEKVQTSEEALKAIANACNRNPRETILKLEDLAKSHGYHVDLETVLKETGTIDSDMFVEYFRASNAGLEDIMNFRQTLKERGIDISNFYKGLTNFVISCINIVMGINLEYYTKDYVLRVKKFFGMYTTEDIDTLLQILEYTRKNLNSDESMGELLYLTTSLRIGKTKLLSVGLYNHAMDAEKQTKNGNRKHVEESRRELDEHTSADKGNNPVLNSALIATAFGKEVAEVNSTRKVNLFDDNDEDDDEEKIASDESFLNDVLD